MQDEDEGTGLLGEYAVVIVPPTRPGEQWFVTVGAWDQDAESYVSGTDGPIVETRGEAMAEVERVLEWLAAQSPDDDLLKIWERMQQDLGPSEIQQPRHGFPWTG